MNWLDKSIDLTILDLIVIATVGGLVVYALGKLFDFLFTMLNKKYAKKIRKARRSVKFKYMKEAYKRKKLFQSGYDHALYNLVSNENFFRFLFPSERKYLKLYKEVHEEQIKINEEFFKESIRINTTPWK
ncbi:hypothetical protein [Planococcus rifietoensis]|uniref:hypothetical protein n=1 Tax=Planococcus rifietoensis TaxID=200991 RepID=UPI00384F5523